MIFPKKRKKRKKRKKERGKKNCSHESFIGLKILGGHEKSLVQRGGKMEEKRGLKTVTRRVAKGRVKLFWINTSPRFFARGGNVVEKFSSLVTTPRSTSVKKIS